MKSRGMRCGEPDRGFLVSQRAANAFAAGFNQLGAVLAQHRDKLAANEAA